MPRMGKRASWVSSTLSWEAGEWARGGGFAGTPRTPLLAPWVFQTLLQFLGSWGSPALRIPKSSPGSVPSGKMGQGLPGYPACPRHRDPPLGRQVVRLAAQS